jgi:hypothetical protein
VLHQAQPLETGRFARAVLLHHTRLHPAEADRLLRWLHEGKAEQHLLAARLLAQHLPASAELVSEFLTVVRGWAMTTQHPARLIVSQASRATHHHGLADWLAGLMGDRLAPFESRAEAATALVVRLRDAHTGEAFALLRSAVDDQSASVQHRLIAAEALAHSGSDEREAAERGLCSVLRDPFASGRDCRTAAVVLASFGGHARDFAVAELNRLLSDVDTPNPDLVNAATALIEIGTEFHEHCADTFLAVIRDPVHNMAGKRDAALGLVALGEQELAAETITEVARDGRLPAVYRAEAADILALLGPRMRVAAGALLAARLDAFDARPSDREPYLTSLAQGSHRDLAIDLMRGLLADPSTPWIDVVSTAAALGQLGPDFHDEAAAHLERALHYGEGTHFDFVFPLRTLANLAEPHRSRATARLRAALTDLVLEADVRCDVARELIRCAPEFHAVAAEQLVVMASSEPDPAVRAKAWAQLHRLGPALAERALGELLTLARDHEALAELGIVFAAASAADRRAAADVLADLLHDRQRSVRTRLHALQGLILLGRAFHRVALAGMLELLRAGLISSPSVVARYFTSTGRGIRAELALALGDLLRTRSCIPRHRWSVIEAFGVIGREPPPAAARELFDNESVSLSLRAQAAVKVASEAPAELSRVLDVVFAAPTVMNFDRWKELIGDLTRLGVDVRARLRDVVASPDLGRHATAEAASLVDPEQLRACSEDEYSEHAFRSYAYRLRALGGDRAAAIGYLTSVLDNPDEPILNRCSAAVQLAELDQAFRPQATEIVWRFARSRHLRVADRVDATEQLAKLVPAQSPRLAGVIADLLHESEAGDEAAVSLVALLPKPARTAYEQALLADHSIAVEHRMPKADPWGDVRLRTDAEAAVREVLRSPEYGAGSRHAALAALAQHSSQAEAVALLIAEGSGAALKKAAKLGTWAEVRDRLHAAAVDEDLPMRERRAAALVIGEVEHRPSVRDFLRNDVQASWRDRADELRFIEAFDELRAIRDDSTLPPHYRRRAAAFLIYRSIDDRVACGRVFASIAADTSVHPGLRWWAADDLAGLGARGRAEALPLLSAMARDDSFPVVVRSDVADAIGKRWPTKREEVLRLLRGLLPLAKPLQRIQVLRNIGAIRAQEGVDGLNAMAADRELGPVVRLWAAIRMFELRRDMKERAAVVAREIAFDENVPAHVRRRAAQKLARWSEVCREDARQLLRTLRLPC